MVKIDSEAVISLSEAARMKGTTRQNVWNWISAGRLTPLYIGGKPFLRRRDVEKFERPAMGRPRKDAAAISPAKTSVRKTTK